MAKNKTKQRSHRGAGRRRRLGNGLTLSLHEGPPLGPGVVSASPEEVMAAIGRLDPDLPWAKVRDMIVPMMPRVRPYPAPAPDPVRMLLAPGILVGFGIDIGPALTVVGSGLLETWDIDVGLLAGTALDNLRSRAEACSPGQIHRDAVADVPVDLLQTGGGFAASLLLVPDHIERLFGAGPHLLVAPMRDILIALPVDVDQEFASWLSAEFEVLDPNHLHLGGFHHERGVVTPVSIEETLAQA
jgi:hypothetical protein